MGNRQGLVLMCLLFAGKAFGAVDITVNPRALKGISLTQAQKLAKALEIKRTARMQAFHKEREALFRAVESATADVRKKLQAAVEGDSGLKEGMRKYRADASTLAKLNASDKKSRLRQIKLTYQDLFARAFKKAGIDEKKKQKDVEDVILAASTKSLGAGKWSFRWDQNLSLFMQWLGDHSSDNQPQDLEFLMEPPFPNKQQEDRNLTDVGQNTSTGTYSLRAEAGVIGTSGGLSGLGHFVTIPGDFLHAKLIAALPDTTYDVMAFAFGGASGSSAASHVDVLSNNDIVCEEVFDHGSVLSIVGWVTDTAGTDTFNISCRFNAPPANTEVVVSFYSSVDAWAGGIAGAVARVAATPRDLKLQLSN